MEVAATFIGVSVVPQLSPQAPAFADSPGEIKGAHKNFLLLLGGAGGEGKVGGVLRARGGEGRERGHLIIPPPSAPCEAVRNFYQAR